MLYAVKMDIETDGSGDDTVVAGLSDAPRVVFAVEWVDGTLADGVDAVLSAVNTESGVDQTLLTLTDANDDAWYFPRTVEHDLTGSDRTSTAMPVVAGDLQLVVSNGGASKTGACVVYLAE